MNNTINGMRKNSDDDIAYIYEKFCNAFNKGFMNPGAYVTLEDCQKGNLDEIEKKVRDGIREHEMKFEKNLGMGVVFERSDMYTNSYMMNIYHIIFKEFSLDTELLNKEYVKMRKRHTDTNISDCVKFGTFLYGTIADVEHEIYVSIICMLEKDGREVCGNFTYYAKMYETMCHTVENEFYNKDCSSERAQSTLILN